MKFEISLSSRQGCMMRVHRAGCADAQKHTNNVWAVEAENAEEAVANEMAEFAAQDQEFMREDFEILACAKTSKKAQAVAQEKEVAKVANSESTDIAVDKEGRLLTRKGDKFRYRGKVHQQEGRDYPLPPEGGGRWKWIYGDREGGKVGGAKITS